MDAHRSSILGDPQLVVVEPLITGARLTALLRDNLAIVGSEERLPRDIT
jgi:hypothetical protein